MKLVATVTLLALTALASGCSTSPPPPKRCEGEFRPINAPSPNAAVSTSSLTAAAQHAMCSKGGVSNGEQA